MLKQNYKKIKVKISPKLEPIRQNNIHFQTQRPDLTPTRFNTLCPLTKNFLLASEMIGEIGEVKEFTTGAK